MMDFNNNYKLVKLYHYVLKPQMGANHLITHLEQVLMALVHHSIIGLIKEPSKLNSIIILYKYFLLIVL